MLVESCILMSKDNFSKLRTVVYIKYSLNDSELKKKINDTRFKHNFTDIGFTFRK